MALTLDDPAVAKLGASFLGSLISLRFIKGTKIEIVLMFIGGVAVSFYSTDPVASWINGGPQTMGLVGFFLGLLGMTVVSKLYEVINSIETKFVVEAIKEWVMKKWGA